MLEMRNTFKIVVVTLEGKISLGYIGIDGRIILK
jgi:hypothetical protein